MIFGKHRKAEQIEILTDKVKIERVKEHTFLGVILSHNVSWKPKIANICSKMAKIIAIMGRSKHVLNQKDLSILYWSLILPYINVLKFGGIPLRAI